MVSRNLTDPKLCEPISAVNPTHEWKLSPQTVQNQFEESSW